jgi:hypothetical protein
MNEPQPHHVWRANRCTSAETINPESAAELEAVEHSFEK